MKFHCPDCRLANQQLVREIKEQYCSRQQRNQEEAAAQDHVPAEDGPAQYDEERTRSLTGPRIIATAVLLLLSSFFFFFALLPASSNIKTQQRHTPISSCISAPRLQQHQALPIPPAWLPHAMQAAWAIPNRPEIAIAWAIEGLPLQSPGHGAHPLHSFWIEHGFFEPGGHLRRVLWDGDVWWMNGSLEAQMARLRQTKEQVEADFAESPLVFRICSWVAGTDRCRSLLPSPTYLFRSSLSFTEEVSHFCADVRVLSELDRFRLKSRVLNNTFSMRHEIWSQLEQVLMQYGGPAGASTASKASIGPDVYHFLDGLAAMDAEAVLLEWLAMTILTQYIEVARLCQDLRPSPAQAATGLVDTFSRWMNERQHTSNTHARADMDDGVRKALHTLFATFGQGLPFRLVAHSPSTAPDSAHRGLFPGMTPTSFNWQKSSLEQSFKRSSVGAVCDHVISLHALTLAADEKACVQQARSTSSVHEQILWDYWWNRANPNWIQVANMTREASQLRYQPLQDAWPRMDKVQPCKRRLEPFITQ